MTVQEKKKENEEEPSRKLYKGEVKKIKEVELVRPVPVQPVTRKFSRAGYDTTIPPTFILTRFTPGYYPGSKLMHYFDPKARVHTAVDVPDGFELNILSGRRAQELNSEWNTVVNSELARVSHRLSCTIGADPEVFLVKGGKVVPAWELLPAKSNPALYSASGGWNGTLYWDGFQAEFTTPAGVTCLVELSNCIAGALSELHRRANGANFTLDSVVPVDQNVLREAKEEHVAFGCAPSKNIYGLKGNTEHGRVVPYRFAGGHIHFGISGLGVNLVEMVRALDAVLGIACVSLFADYDSPIRRKFYGQAGEYRTPVHGLEYRVLSNAWLSHPVIMHMVFDLARAAAGVVASGLNISDIWKTKEEDTIRAIQDTDVDLARRILSENQRVFMQIMYTGGSSYSKYQDRAWKAWFEGMDTLIKNPKNIEENWGITGQRWTDFAKIKTFSVAAGSKADKV